jgi:hypothetical protein
LQTIKQRFFATAHLASIKAQEMSLRKIVLLPVDFQTTPNSLRLRHQQRFSSWEGDSLRHDNQPTTKG